MPCLTFKQLCSKLWARAVENSHEQHEFLVSHSTDSTVATFAMAAFRRVVAAAALAVTSVLAETQQFATVPLLGGPLDDNLEIPTQFHQHWVDLTDDGFWIVGLNGSKGDGGFVWLCMALWHWVYHGLPLPKLHSRTAAENPAGRWTGTFPIGEPSRTRCGVACPRQSWSRAQQVPGRAAGNKQVSNQMHQKGSKKVEQWYDMHDILLGFYECRSIWGLLHLWSFI